jgi:hypothetical protein
VNPTEIILTLAILFGLGFWMRGYYAPARRTFLRWRELIGQFRRLRQMFMQGTASRNNPPGGFRNDPRAQPREKVVDVHASRGQERRAAPSREQAAAPVAPQVQQCPACGDTLNEAQIRALQAKSVRCPGSNRVGQTCPFYGERTLN